MSKAFHENGKERGLQCHCGKKRERENWKENKRRLLRRKKSNFRCCSVSTFRRTMYCAAVWKVFSLLVFLAFFRLFLRKTSVLFSCLVVILFLIFLVVIRFRWFLFCCLSVINELSISRSTVHLMRYAEERMPCHPVIVPLLIENAGRFFLRKQAGR